MRVVIQIANCFGQTKRAVSYSIGQSLSDVLKKIKNKDDGAAIGKSVLKLEAALNLRFFITGSISDSVAVAVNENLNSLKPSLAEMLELHEILLKQHVAGDFSWSGFDSILMDRIRAARADLIEAQMMEFVSIIAEADVKTGPELREKLVSNASVLLCLSTVSTLFEAQHLDKGAKPLNFESLRSELDRCDIASRKKILSQIRSIASPLDPDGPQLPRSQKQLFLLCASIHGALDNSPPPHV
jgi:hypothetical protein